MVIFVTEGGSDRQELTEALLQEGVAYQECKMETVRELDTASYRLIEVQANLPEVKVPPEYSQGDIGARAWRLPSGRLIITDESGSLEQIAPALPYSR
jgi:hypothetical protein